jgi:hypothetical protein
MADSHHSTRVSASPLVRSDLTFNRPAIRAEARRRFEAKGRFAAAHGGFPRFLKDAFASPSGSAPIWQQEALRAAPVRLPRKRPATPLF